jgi:DNA-binding response OmpR family regulator
MSRKQGLSGLRVLLVEDEYLIAHDACMWLRGAGAEVIGPARSSLGAFNLMRSTPVDAAVIDINLGLGPDFDLASHLSRCGVPFLFATGYGCEAIPSRFATVPRVEKPFTDAQLLREVHKLASRPAPAQPLPAVRRAAIDNCASQSPKPPCRNRPNVG